MKVLPLHPENPQKRLIAEAVKVFKQGGLVIYPTDSGYSIGCDAHNVKAIQKLYQAKRHIKKYWMALLVSEFSSIPEFALVDNKAFKAMKQVMPGPYTFILPAQMDIIRKLKVKRKEIGVRMSKHPVVKGLFEGGVGPILNTAARLEEDLDYTDNDELIKHFKGVGDLFLDIGELQLNPTSIINFTDGYPEVLRGEWPY